MSYKTIKLKKYQDIVNEYDAAGTITPGALLELTSADKVQNHSTATGPAAAMFALEDELQGNSTRDDYSADDKVQVWHVTPGEEVLALIDSGLDPDIGDILEPSTGGELQAQTTSTGPLFQVIASKIQDDADTPNHRVAVRRL